MRDAFHDDLDSIEATLVEMAQLVNRAMERATTALLTADLKIAEEVISDDSKIDALHHDLDGCQGDEGRCQWRHRGFDDEHAGGGLGRPRAPPGARQPLRAGREGGPPRSFAAQCHAAGSR